MLIPLFPVFIAHVSRFQFHSTAVQLIKCCYVLGVRVSIHFDPSAFLVSVSSFVLSCSTDAPDFLVLDDPSKKLSPIQRSCGCITRDML